MLDAIVKGAAMVGDEVTVNYIKAVWRGWRMMLRWEREAERTVAK
jgi:hypothetical protein